MIASNELFKMVMADVIHKIVKWRRMFPICYQQMLTNDKTLAFYCISSSVVCRNITEWVRLSVVQRVK